MYVNDNVYLVYQIRFLVREKQGLMNFILRCFSWPFTIYPLLLYGIFIAFQLVTLMIKWFLSFTASMAWRVIAALDHLVNDEIPAWQDSALSYLPILLFDWLIIPFHYHSKYLRCIFWPPDPKPFQDYRRHFKGTITAFHKDRCVFSHYQYSSWFAHLIGAMIHSAILAWHGTKRWYEIVDLYRPIYTYFAKELKKPPDNGIITGSIIFWFMIGMNIILFLRGLYLICFYILQKRRKGNRVRPSLYKEPICYLLCDLGSDLYDKYRKVREKCSVLGSSRLNSKDRSCQFCLATLELPEILTKAFASDSRGSTVSFDSDSTTIVLDNSATCHICNDKDMFIGNITPIPKDSQLGVETAGGTAKPVGFGSIRISFRDNDGNMHVEMIEDVLYFPSSPVNILGITKFGEQRRDPEGTHILTKAKYSVFTWNNGKSTRDIHHQSSGLPELPINEGMSVFSSFYLSFCSMLPTLDVTKKCLLSRLQEYSAQTSTNSVSFASKCCLRSSFKIGDKVNLINPGSTQGGRIDDAEFNKDMQPRFKVKLPDGRVKNATVEQLRRIDEPDVGIVPQTPSQLAADADLMSKDALKAVLCPEVLSKDEEDFMHWHHRLNHLSATNMLRLAKAGILPKTFLKLNKIPKCASCAFGQAHRRQWRSKGHPGGHIRSKAETKPGDGVSVDQIVSAQPGLIPQMVGFLTNHRIVGATVFVDRVTQYIYVHLMKALTTDNIIAAKSACKRRFSQFGHKIHHCRADNGRFSDAAFIDDVHYCSQRISFCGVGAHH